MSEDHRSTAISMNLSTENSNKAQAELILEFYAAKEAKGEALDIQQKADKAFWESNLSKAIEKIAYFESIISSTEQTGV